jgi:dTMP kinase
MKDFFIIFEGIDGTGKTTQLRLLHERIKSLHEDTVVVKEPGDVVDGKYIGSEIGAKVREILFFDPVLKTSTGVLDRDVRDLLFLCDHIQLFRKTIEPALKAGKLVISDRYADSQFAYGPAKDSTPWIQKLYRQKYGPLPDVIVLLVGDPAILAPRTKRTGTEAGKQEGKSWAGLEGQKLIRDAYLLNLGGKKETVVVDVTPEGRCKNIEEVAEEIWTGVKQRWDKKWSRKSKPIQEDLPLEAHPNSQPDGYYEDEGAAG